MRSPEDAPERPVRESASSQRFVDAALDLFVEHGFNGTSLQMIGDRLGVTKAAITYHFKSKDELLVAVVTPAFEALAALLEDAEAVRRESVRRKQTLVRYVDYLIEHRRFTSWLTRDVGAIAHQSVWGPAQELSARIDAILTSQAQSPVGEVWGAAITQALSGPVLREIDLPDDLLREQLLAIGEQLIRGAQAALRREKGQAEVTR